MANEDVQFPSFASIGDAAKSFFWPQPPAVPLTQDALKRRYDLTKALLSRRPTPAPVGLGPGIYSIASDISDAAAQNRLSAEERAYQNQIGKEVKEGGAAYPSQAPAPVAPTVAPLAYASPDVNPVRIGSPQ
jgi:hypothetical protein